MTVDRIAPPAPLEKETSITPHELFAFGDKPNQKSLGWVIGSASDYGTLQAWYVHKEHWQKHGHWYCRLKDGRVFKRADKYAPHETWGWEEVVSEEEAAALVAMSRPAPGVRPKLGENWFVRLPGATSLARMRVIGIQERVVILTDLSDQRFSPAYAIADLEFIEQVVLEK